MNSLQGVAPGDPVDPAPTTGGPVDYDWPDGCVCSLHDDIDWGEHLVSPRTGCPIHTPWAFPGYSLAHETQILTIDGDVFAGPGWPTP